MKKYKVTVNGNLYEITLEVVDEADVKNPSAPAAPAAQTSSSAAAPADGAKVTSPMPGTILAVNVKEGQSVKKGEVLMILEAMKMENEILAPADGKVASLGVAKGASVSTGALLCVIA
ncbi:MAG: biotin/lipoyl-binding protein [Clostridia bacterium]|nr:biotin/lipoyl-binding protein [Clostridia bacterium]